MSYNGKYTTFFMHDTDMRNDPKVELLMQKYDWLGYAYMVALFEDMAKNSPSYSVRYADEKYSLLYANRFKLKHEEYKEYISYCAAIELFVFNQDGDITSKSMIRRMTNRDAATQRKIEISRKAAEKRWGKRTETNVPTDLPDWFALFVAQFRTEYPKGAKAFVGAETVQTELRSACTVDGTLDKDIAKKIVVGAHNYRLHVESMDADEEKFELIAASRWIKDKGWLNSYGVTA